MAAFKSAARWPRAVYPWMMPSRGQAVAFCDQHGQPVVLTTQPGTMLAFVDETGHEDFAPNHRVFGFGGIAVMASHYVKRVREPWFELKERILGSSAAQFHAADFPRDAEHEAALCEFFRSNRFVRFAVVSPRPLSAPDWELFPRGPGEIHPVYESLSLILRQALVFAKDLLGCAVSRVAFAQEGSQRSDWLADRYFRAFALAEPCEDMPVQLLRTSKNLREPGCEVADFVANAAGRQLRAQLRGDAAVSRFHGIFEAEPVRPLALPFLLRGIEAQRTARSDAEGRLTLRASMTIQFAPLKRGAA